MKRIFALTFTSLLLASCGHPQSPTNPNPVAGQGSLAFSRAPLVFNAGNAVASDTRTLEVINTSSTAATLTAATVVGTDAALFKVQQSNFALPLEVPAKGKVPLTVSFTPTAATSPGPLAATLELTTQNAAETTLSLPLGALVVAGQGGTKEPSAQWILDTFGYQIDLGDDDPATSALTDGVVDAAVGEGIDAERFTRADANKPIDVQVLAAFGVPEVDPIYSYGYYDASAATPAPLELFSVPASSTPGTQDHDYNGQKLEPTLALAAAAKETGLNTFSFTPQSDTFGFYSYWPTTKFFEARTVYSEDALNTFAGAAARQVRVYPFKGRDGRVVTNSYLLITDESARLFDYNDAMVVVSNIKPIEAAPKPNSSAP